MRLSASHLLLTFLPLECGFSSPKAVVFAGAKFLEDSLNSLVVVGNTRAGVFALSGREFQAIPYPLLQGFLGMCYLQPLENRHSAARECCASLVNKLY